MPKSKSNHKKPSILSRIKIDDFIAAVNSFGNRIRNLRKESWRLNSKKKESSSLLGAVGEKLGVDDSEETRHALYNLLRRHRDDLRNEFRKMMNADDHDPYESNNDNSPESGEVSVEDDGNIQMQPQVSVPLPERPHTRTNENQQLNNDDDNNHSSNSFEKSFVLTAKEWHTAYSYTEKKLKNGWTSIFATKLKNECGTTCALRVRNKNLKKGQRKQASNYFWFELHCTNSECERKYLVMLPEEAQFEASPMFRVRITGKINHNRDIQTMSRHLTGEERQRVGERVNQIGPTAVYRERLEAADEKLLEEGNLSEVKTIEALKKTRIDYNNKFRFDEDIFRDCRVLASSFRTTDTESTHIEGYIQVIGEIPFRVHFFSEKQIDQYAIYCKKEKYSFAHIDATSGVIKRLRDQGPPLLYTMLIKTGDDPTNNIPVAHAILTDNTVPSISYFLGNLAHSITNYKKKLILPSFFVIDFSAALMNSILQSFNGENINTHLGRCWNTIHRKYNKIQLRSLSFIHLCCCHVIHAIARSLTQANIDKKIRKSLLYIFALILCGNDIEQLFNLLGSLVEIFGDPTEQNAQEKFDQLLARELDVDEETVKMLENRETIFIDAEKDDDFKLVDEYLRSSTPIIHQSPFNIEAIKRYPLLSDLLNSKSKISTNVNSLFSRSIIRVIYRWWAYLPLWTGLLWNFEERYANDITTNVALSYYPLRYSNAVLESYFHMYKTSILQKKGTNTPRELIEATYRSIKIQFKGIKYDITQSSKGRKRRKKDITPVEKHKKGAGKPCRAVYVGVIDKAKRLIEQKKKTPKQSNIETIPESTSEDENESMPPSNQSSPISNRIDVIINPIESIEPLQSDSTASSSTVSSEVSMEFSQNIINSLDEPIPNDEQSDASTEFEFDENMNMSSIIDTLYKGPTTATNQALYQSGLLINGEVYPWPAYGIENVIIDGRSYTFSSTCALDSVLFSLYFIQRKNIDIADEFRMAPSTSPYSVLSNTFRIVDTQGWNEARIHWLHHFNLIDTTRSRTICLFGKLEDIVINVLEEQQRYSSRTTCSKEDCPNKQQLHTNTKIDLFPNDSEFKVFKADNYSVCCAMIKKLDEITEEEAHEKDYNRGSRDIKDPRTNKTVKIKVWECNGNRCTRSATFIQEYPPIIFAEIKPPLSKRGAEGYAESHARLRDMKTIVTIGTVQYRLEAVIHHKNNHFTATVIGADNEYYHFDDRLGIRDGRACIDLVEYGIYRQIYTF